MSKEGLLSAEQKRFSALAAMESYACRIPSEECGIGIYNEKRLHRILKRTLCENEDCFEIKVGRYIADILGNGVITEIQCGSMTPLARKLEFYLENTDYSILAVHPLIAQKKLIRANRENGEIAHIKTSPKHEGYIDGLARLYPIRELLLSERITVCFALCTAEEYRFSERMRYRKKGKYDSELFPTALLEMKYFAHAEDFRELIPKALLSREFTAKDFAKAAGLSQRNAYSALHTLKALGLLDMQKQGNAYAWRVIN